MEHIEWTHPFRVTLSQIIVHGYHVYTVASQGIQEDGEGSHEGLTFTSRHLGNLTLMEYGTTKQLHVIVDHFPLQIVTAGSPVVMIDGLVAINRDKVFLGIGSQLAIEVRSCYNGLFVLCETTGCLFHDGKDLSLRNDGLSLSRWQRPLASPHPVLSHRCRAPLSLSCRSVRRYRHAHQ